MKTGSKIKEKCMHRCYKVMKLGTESLKTCDVIYISMNNKQGRHGRQGSQGLILGWILRNRKCRQQWWRTGEVAATMASLPAKNLP